MNNLNPHIDSALKQGLAVAGGGELIKRRMDVDHKFSDEQIESASIYFKNDDEEKGPTFVELDIEYGTSVLSLNKADVEALAIHFGSASEALELLDQIKKAKDKTIKTLEAIAESKQATIEALELEISLSSDETGMDKAEQQLTGFSAAIQGEDVVSLAETMGLTGNEWEKLKPDVSSYMREVDIDSLNEHFGII